MQTDSHPDPFPEPDLRNKFGARLNAAIIPLTPVNTSRFAENAPQPQRRLLLPGVSLSLIAEESIC
jgi:hypothetical protein